MYLVASLEIHCSMNFLRNEIIFSFYLISIGLSKLLSRKYLYFLLDEDVITAIPELEGNLLILYTTGAPPVVEKVKIT